MIFGLFGNSTNAQPEDNWYLVDARLKDGRPAVGRVNGIYCDFPDKALFPWSLRLNIGLNLDDTRADGLPLSQERKIAQKFEDELIAGIHRQSTVHYVGHLYNDSFLDVYLYVADPDAVHAYLQKRIEDKDHTRGFGYEMTKDPHWKEVEFLLNAVE